MNRLANESSPYLRQHAENPVDWYPWGPEALERSRREDKPILLSVGYSACHWCHVMAHESFENPDIAALMNSHFVNIKLDREERPDLDQLYQGVVQLMGRGGGWPLTVFLKPDLTPFYGGTYFPSEDRYGMPGFPKLLLALSDAYKNRRQDIEEQSQQFKEGLAHIASYGLDANSSELKPDDIVSAAQSLEREIDRVHGGFGGAPKFPNPMNVALLLRGWRRSKDQKLLSAVLLTLERMANGGIYDQLGGGFHRYSVDQKWLVPHFEKMLYDNAQLLHLYSEAQQIEPRPLWKKVVEETVAYVQREMTSKDGAFFAAQDADSEGEEGKFFVWKPDEIRKLLPKADADVLLRHFGVTERGNFEHGHTVLEVVEPTDDPSLARSREVLFKERDKRVHPGLDDKVLTGWNGLMIRGLAFAARVFDRPDWAQLAARAADFILRTMWKNGRLLRAYKDGNAKIDGFIEDYGDFAAGLVALYQATFDPKYLEAARELSAAAVSLFWDSDKSAYLAAAKGNTDLITATYALHDNAYPSGASSLTEAQVALAALTGDTALLEQASKYLRKLRDNMLRNAFAFGHLLLAADSYVDGA
ncbi:MAG: thioredoxin domain-containing protein, partial [Myxococcaceae bacterium]